jgi:opacity protein-like surface antigen
MMIFRVEAGMNRISTSVLASALVLGLISSAEAETWSGLHLTFGLGGSDFTMREDRSGGPPVTRDTEFAPYAAIGYDWSFDTYALGIVADIDTGGADNDDMLSQGKGTYGNSDWFATFRGRVGTPISDEVHVYASGGLAFMRTGATNVDLFGVAVEADEQMLRGAVVGLGAEYMLSPGRHVTVEYLYADFEESDTFFEGSSEAASVQPVINTFRIGYTFRF